MYLLTIISNVVLLSFFGYITTLLARIKMRYVAVFNMSAYALTLSVILNMLYVAVNIFVTFNMEYFQVMYVAVAAIYLVAAILILKADFMKKQLELMKIAEAEAIVKKEMEQEEKDNKEKEERRKKDKEEEKKKRNKKKKKKKRKKNAKEKIKKKKKIIENKRKRIKKKKKTWEMKQKAQMHNLYKKEEGWKNEQK